VDITPNIYKTREEILYAATHGAGRVSLNKWLKEPLVYSKKGQILNVRAAIKYIAGREGSHIINPATDKEREDVAISFSVVRPTMEDIRNTDFDQWNPWQQFAIDAGMRLLNAKHKSGDRLFAHTISVPRTSGASQTMRIQKRRAVLRQRRRLN